MGLGLRSLGGIIEGSDVRGFYGGGVLEEFGGFRYRFYGFMRFMDWRV